MANRPNMQVTLKAACEVMLRSMQDWNLSTTEVNQERQRLEEFARNEGGDPSFVMALVITKVVDEFNKKRQEVEGQQGKPIIIQ